jgi:hypothetical protein
MSIAPGEKTPAGRVTDNRARSDVGPFSWPSGICIMAVRHLQGFDATMSPERGGVRQRSPPAGFHAVARFSA